MTGINKTNSQDAPVYPEKYQKKDNPDNINKTLATDDDISSIGNSDGFDPDIEPITDYAKQNAWKSSELNLYQAEKSMIKNIIEAVEDKPEFESNLYNLLESDKLTKQTDGEGRTLLENLYDMSQQKFTPELKKQDIIEQTVSHLARPENVRQRKQASCAAATLQYIQAREHPADYTKTIAGLTGKEGKVDLGYGDIIETNQTALEKDKSKRDDVCRVYQASAMDYANGDLNYINPEQKHEDPNES
jgi:hypothetical protein